MPITKAQSPWSRRFFVQSLACGLAIPTLLPQKVLGKEVVSHESSLEAQIELATKMLWDRFYIPEVKTFADYISSYEPGKTLDHLPHTEEVQRQFPNPCGYSTGMEDGLILGGAILSTFVDQHIVTKDPEIASKAKAVFEGIYLCGTAHGVPGFMARNVCREDLKSVYINSSRDQYTHAIHGVWKFVKSELCDEESREKAKKLLTEVGDRMIRTMVPETEYDFLRADEQRCPLRICRMWEVQSHEAARLPMIYAAAWDITQNPKYRTEWRKYIHEAIAQSKTPGKQKPAYALLQMQCSLELLYQLEPEAALKKEIAEIMALLSEMGEQRFHSVFQNWQQLTPEQQEELGPDWRLVRIWRNQNGYPNPQWGDYRKSWHLAREAGEASLLPLMSATPIYTDLHKSGLTKCLLNMNYSRNSSCGIVYHIGSYWKAKRFQQL